MSAEPIGGDSGHSRPARRSPVREALLETVATFREWLYMPNELTLLCVLAAVAANRIPGDPVWLLVVGPPSGGKTELLQALFGLPDVYPTGEMTQASLLSGVTKKDYSGGAKGGLLRQLGKFGIIVCKDFGTVLSMNRDARATLLAALREVYDGSWVRRVGTDGGRELSWEGKVGMLAGCTAAIDRHHSVMAAMGERFITIRLPELSKSDRWAMSQRSLDHRGAELRMRRELRESVSRLFEVMGEPDDVAPVDPGEKEKLSELAVLVTSARSAVERDNFSREIEIVPEAEAPGRLALQLARLLQGMSAVGVPFELGWEAVTMTALGSIPALRLFAMRALLRAWRESDGTGSLNTSDLAEATRHPAVSVKRALEDLTGHGVVVRLGKSSSGGNVLDWRLAPWAADLLDRTIAPAVHD